MKLCRFDASRIGLVEDDWVHDVSAALAALPAPAWPGEIGDALIRYLDHLRPRIMAERGRNGRRRLAEVRLDSPVARPSKVIGAPANYQLHIEESKTDAAIAASGPIRSIRELGLFLKASSSLVGFGEGVTLRFPKRRTDHEAEFVVVIGREARDVPPERSLDCVAGYTLGLDVTLRGGEERSFRKSIDSYTVAGPWLLTRDELEDPDDLPFTLRVNGALRQDAHTRDMIFGVRELIALASSFYTLYPGDLIFTGAPAGVGQIEAGDVISLAAPGLGESTVHVR